MFEDIFELCTGAFGDDDTSLSRSRPSSPGGFELVRDQPHLQPHRGALIRVENRFVRARDEFHWDVELRMNSLSHGLERNGLTRG